MYGCTLRVPDPRISDGSGILFIRESGGHGNARFENSGIGQSRARALFFRAGTGNFPTGMPDLKNQANFGHFM